MEGIPESEVDRGAHEAATSPQNGLPEPTQAQKEAGNYKLGHVSVGGVPIAIENPAGSTRRGVDRNGKPWESTLSAHYGYVKGSTGADGDAVDVFVKPGTAGDWRGPVFVVNQSQPDTGRFDEHKAVIGAGDWGEAAAIYHANYAKDWKGFGSMTEMSQDQFKGWLNGGKRDRPARHLQIHNLVPDWKPTARREGYVPPDLRTGLFGASREEVDRVNQLIDFYKERGEEGKAGKLPLEYSTEELAASDERQRALAAEAHTMAPGDSVVSPEVEAQAKKDGITSAERRLKEVLGIKGNGPDGLNGPDGQTEVEQQNARILKELEALETKEPKIDQVKAQARGLVNWAKRLWEETTQLPPEDPYKRGINRYVAKLQASELEVMGMVRHLTEQVPDELAREGITNWRVAQGDENKLRAWANLSADPRAKAGYEAALRLTPEQKKIALALNDYYQSKLGLGIERGMLENGVANYATQIWRDDKGQKLEEVQFQDYERDAHGAPLRDAEGNFIQKIGRKYSQGFQFANPRQFEDFFSGEAMGFRPLTKDAASLLGIYGSEFNRTLALRELVKELTEVKAADGRPIVGVGVSQPLWQYKEGETPDAASGAFHIAKPEDSAGYKTLNHPVFERWKFTVPAQSEETTQPGGRPGGPSLPGSAEGAPALPGMEGDGSNAVAGVLRQGNLTVHPEYEKLFNNLVGESAIRQWANSKGSALAEAPKAVLRGLMWTNAEMKGLTFVGSPFHIVHLAKRSAGYRINPFEGLEPINTDLPLHRRALLSGLMVAPDQHGLDRWLDGLGGEGVRIADLIPGVKQMGEWTFHTYIPRLKMKSWTILSGRMLETFRPQLEGGKMTVYQVENYAARIVNNAFGHLNYAEMGRNPTVQHLLSLSLLAPDFSESTARHLVDAARGVIPGGSTGHESAKSIAVLALGTMIVAKTLNKLIDGEWHMDHPFSVIVGNREYSIRSQVADLQHLFHDWRSYTTARVSPIGNTAWMAWSKQNYRGEPMDWSDQAREFVARWIPSTVKAIPGFNKISPTDAARNVAPLEAFSSSMGFKINRYSPSKEINALADAFLQEHGRPSMKGAYQPSRFTALRNSLDDGKIEDAKAEYKSLLHAAVEETKRKARAGIKVEDPVKALEQSFRTSVFHPIIADAALQGEFLRGLTPHQKELFKESLKHRTAIWQRFSQITGRSALPPAKLF